MKKWLWAVCAVWFAPAFCAGQNTVRMVTYFPVPYAAYNDLRADTCDVGLAGSCTIKSGKKFKVQNTMTVQEGSLNLNGGNITGTTLAAGSGISSNSAEIVFSDNLAVESIPNAIQTLESSGQTEIAGSLTLKGADKDHVFPACDAADHEIAWRQLNLGQGNKIYLTCGTGDDVPECADKMCPMGSVLNKETCLCEKTIPCTITCEENQELNEETCTCEDINKCNHPRDLDNGTENVAFCCVSLAGNRIYYDGDAPEMDWPDANYCCGTIYSCCYAPNQGYSNCQDIKIAEHTDDSCRRQILGSDWWKDVAIRASRSCGIPIYDGESSDVPTWHEVPLTKILDCKDNYQDYSCKEYDDSYAVPEKQCSVISCKGNTQPITDDRGCKVTCTLRWWE